MNRPSFSRSVTAAQTLTPSSSRRTKALPQSWHRKCQPLVLPTCRPNCAISGSALSSKMQVSRTGATRSGSWVSSTHCIVWQASERKGCALTISSGFDNVVTKEYVFGVEPSLAYLVRSRSCAGCIAESFVHSSSGGEHDFGTDV